MNMKKWFILLLIAICSLPGQAFRLSDEAEISILTCSPGTELYSLFGHTAIRVRDPRQNYDQVFNYGTFDFQTPHFYMKFARGLLPYQLSQTPFRNFIYVYYMDQRSVYAQTLKLDAEQKQKLFDLLLDNYREENRYYLYNFLFDNCSTRSRDILLKSLPDTVVWNMPDTGKSFWNLLDEYLQTSPWVQWGIHTILGQRGNREATPFQYMFLPDYLMFGLETATHKNELIAGKAKTLYLAPDTENNYPWYRTPLFVFTFCSLLLIILLYKHKQGILLNVLTFSIFLFTGILGLLIVFLGGFTAHPITAPNWNILWANPLNLMVLPFLFKKTIRHTVFIYLNGYLILLAVAIPVWIFTQPAVPLPSLPLLILTAYLCWLQRMKYME